MEINIDKVRIQTAIKQITGYTGKGIGEKVDNIAVTDDEERVVGSLCERAITSLLSKLSRYMPVYSNYKIQINTPITFDSRIVPLLEKGIEDLIVSEACSDWFRMARLEDDAQKYASMTDSNFLNVNRLICSRTKPI